MFYGIYDKNIVEYYSMYLFLYFRSLAKWAVFFVHISKSGLKALYYKALSHFLATNLSTTLLFLYTYVAPNTTNQIQAVNLPL